MVTYEVVEINPVVWATRSGMTERGAEEPFTIDFTDGRATRRVEVGQVEKLAARWGARKTRTEWVSSVVVESGNGTQYWIVYEHEAGVRDETVWWKVTYNIPVVGRVQHIVEWPLEEVMAVMKVVVVAKRLRAFTSEPHVYA